MGNVINVFLAMLDFGLSSWMLYRGLTNGTAISFAACLLCFGSGIVQTAIYLKEGD